MRATLDGATFNRLIGAVKAFASGNAVRPQDNLIQLHFSKEGTSVAAYALDGYRAAMEHAVCYTVDEDFAVLVSAPPLKANGKTIVSIEQDDEYAYISYGDIRFRTKRPEGKMFDVQKVIDDTTSKEPAHRIGANADYLIDALKSIKATIGTNRTPVIIEFRGAIEPIILRTDESNVKMVLPVRIK